MRRNKIFGIAFVAMIALAIGYRDLLASAFESNPFPGSAESVARGKQLYVKHCTVCHGSAGHGDGPAAAGLQSKMDDLADLPPPPIFPDGVIVYRIAHGKGDMPGWDQTLRHSECWDLLNYLRTLKPRSAT